MKPFDKLLFPVFGLAFWAAGTVWYRWAGAGPIESTGRAYWINFAVTPVVTTAICIFVLACRHIPPADWARAALLVALPGMFGEAGGLSRFAYFMPRMRPETGGKYGALLFATYALFLTIATVVAVLGSAKSAAP